MFAFKLPNYIEGNGIHFRKIMGFDKGYWKVEYDDGDGEEFNKSDLPNAVFCWNMRSTHIIPFVCWDLARAHKSNGLMRT